MTRSIPSLQTSALSRIGLDYATRDYLSLATHPALRSAALTGLDQPRLDPCGSPGRPGLTEPVLRLEDRIAAFAGLPSAVTFPSGSEAIRMTLLALLGPSDHVIVDAGAHPEMAASVVTARATLHRSPAGSVEAVERRLVRLSRQPRTGRTFLALPAVSAHSSRIPDLAELVALARKFSAILILDTTHDLGAMGPTGRGVMEIQGCVGRIDILIGSLGRTFGAAAGFAAFRDPDMKRRLLQARWHSAALSPVNAGVILAALDLVSGSEGAQRRRKLHGLSLRLRNHLMADGIRPSGQASSLVPILLPPATALARTALLESAGYRMHLLQAPDVPLHAPRWRIALSAAHGPADIDNLAELIRDVTRAFDRSPARPRVPA